MDSSHLAPGTQLGGYVLGPVLGSGGSGTVYRAQDAEGRVVAFKLLHPSLAADDVSRARLRREVAMLQRLQSSRIARVLDAEIDSVDAFLVTEFIEGKTLDSSVRDEGPFSTQELAELAAGLAEALRAIHTGGMVHRDLKPGNIMLSSGGPVVIDFGLAQEGHGTRMTASGLVAGTPGYVAPELLNGGEPSPASDEWGLAAVLAFAATGRQPFGSGRWEAVLARVMSDAPDLGGLPPTVASPLASALRLDPLRRIDTPDLVQALHGAATSRSVTVPAPTMVAPSGQPSHTPPPTSSTAIFPEETKLLPPENLEETRTSVVPSGLESTEETRVFSPEMEPPTQFLPPELPREQFSASRRRFAWPVTVMVFLALVAWAWTSPLATGIIAAAIILVARTVAVANHVVENRREQRGEYHPSPFVTIASAPVYLVRALVGLIPAAVIGGALAAGAWWLKQHYLGQRGFAPHTIAVIGWGAVIGLGILGTWWGPYATRTRMGGRRMARMVPRGAVFLIFLLLAVGVVAIFM